MALLGNGGERTVGASNPLCPCPPGVGVRTLQLWGIVQRWMTSARQGRQRTCDRRSCPLLSPSPYSYPGLDRGYGSPATMRCVSGRHHSSDFWRTTLVTSDASISLRLPCLPCISLADVFLCFPVFIYSFRQLPVLSLPLLSMTNVCRMSRKWVIQVERTCVF